MNLVMRQYSAAPFSPALYKYRYINTCVQKIFWQTFVTH